MNFIIYIIFLFFVLVFAITPFFVLYLFSSFLAFLIGSVFKYRYKVIYQNLSNSFQGLTEKEKKKIIKKVYLNISDLAVESIKSFTMSKKQIKQRLVVLNPEFLDLLYKSNRGVIGVTGHYANWEWAALASSMYLKHSPVGFYKPLSNKHIDQYMKRNRGRNGMHLCSIYVTAISFESYKNKPAFFAMVGDQSPSNANKAYWLDFLNQKTACLHGPENYAKLYNLPVVFLDIQRIKRGHYTVELSKITDEPLNEKNGEITRVYMQKLEAVIRKKPEDWLWSHRRWKIKPKI
ncbi:MAG: lysophospholipid acyltransferase family protein [Bacteroidia bacterium]|nr:lysophospholipid acyltransferase family protein [Bacteroidia bacterium]